MATENPSWAARAVSSNHKGVASPGRATPQPGLAGWRRPAQALRPVQRMRWLERNVDVGYLAREIDRTDETDATRHARAGRTG